MKTITTLLLLLPSPAFAYGEVAHDRPSPEERALHFFTDQLRVDPDATDVQFSSYSPVRPLMYADPLNEAARFYAEDMNANGCFPEDHSSCDGTSFGDRLAAFYSGQAIGENMLFGLSSPEAAVFEGWLYSDGHRENMLSGTWNELGTGFAGTGHWVQDFGLRTQLDETIATSGTHWPLVGSASGSSTWYLAVYDPDGAIDRAHVFLDGSKRELALDRGTADMGTFAYTLDNTGDGCVEYRFEVTRGDGSVVRYPTDGVLLATVGGVSCDWWLPSTQAANPAPGTGNEPGGPSLGAGGNGCSEDGGNQAGAGSNATTYNVQLGSCSVGASSKPGLLALGLLLIAVRRRR